VGVDGDGWERGKRPLGKEIQQRWEGKSNSVGKGNPTALGREIHANKQALRGVVIKPATALGAAAC
jgi:hypothetical protein